MNVSYTKLFKFEAQEFAGGATVDYAGTMNRGGLFHWRTVTTLRYANQGWDVALNWRHLPAIKHANYATDPDTVIQGAGSYDMFGLAGNFNISHRLALGVGVDNLFDRQPERYGAGQVVNIAPINGGGTRTYSGAGSTVASLYDVLGRRYFMNVKLRF
jgi:outer membrane receptor protein involved in Fe transport